MGIAIDRRGLETLREALRALYRYIDALEDMERYDEETHDWANDLATDLDDFIDEMGRRLA